MSKILLALALTLVLAAPGFGATVLWDQPPGDGYGIGSQVFPDYPEFALYVVMDVTVPDSGWTIQSVTTFFNAGTFAAMSGSLLPVQLVILPASGELPEAGADPSAAAQYNGTYSISDGGLAAIDIEGLDILLAPGDYWIGVSPIAAYGSEGQLYLRPAASQVGRSAAWRNPGGGFGYGTDWSPATMISSGFTDGNLHIEGTLGPVPEPSTMGTLAFALIAGAGLFRRARRIR